MAVRGASFAPDEVTRLKEVAPPLARSSCEVDTSPLIYDEEKPSLAALRCTLPGLLQQYSVKYRLFPTADEASAYYNFWAHLYSKGIRSGTGDCAGEGTDTDTGVGTGGCAARGAEVDTGACAIALAAISALML